MTYGLWVDRARSHVQACAHQLPANPPASVMDVLALASSRRDLYRQLARHVDLLAAGGVPPARRARRTLEVAAGHAASADAMRQAFSQAVAASGVLPPASPTSSPSRSLDAAARALALAADIAATHVRPGRRPSTPEGVAIRAGGGVAAALADLARVALDAIAVDLAVPGWLGAGGERAQSVGRPVADAATAIATGVLPSVIADVIAAGITRPALLHDLSAAVTIDGHDEADVVDVADAVAGLRAVSTWLWQNPDQLRSAHLRLGTLAGLAVTMPAHATDVRDAVGRVWGRAAFEAQEIDGCEPAGEARQAARMLDSVVRWARAATNGERAEVTGQLPALARTLFDGTLRAVQRGELFVNRTTLGGQRRGLVVYAVADWRLARMDDPEICLLRASLRTLCRSTDVEVRGLIRVRSAFRKPQPGYPLPVPPPASAATVPIRLRRART